MQRSLDSRSSVQSEVQQYPKLRSLLKTFINDDSDIQGEELLLEKGADMTLCPDNGDSVASILQKDSKQILVS